MAGTLDLDAWEPQAAAFAGSHRVVRYDRRGFGLSDGMPGRGADARWHAWCCGTRPRGRDTLIGVSQGAPSLAFALRNPDRVSALVLDGPPG